MYSQKDKSITELEIIAALEHSNCSRSFFYFRDQDYVKKKFPNGPTEVRQIFRICNKVIG